MLFIVFFLIVVGFLVLVKKLKLGGDDKFDILVGIIFYLEWYMMIEFFVKGWVYIL